MHGGKEVMKFENDNYLINSNGCFKKMKGTNDGEGEKLV